MNLLITILVILFILSLLGRERIGFGYYPSGGLGVVLLILVILLLLGRL